MKQLTLKQLKVQFCTEYGITDQVFNHSQFVAWEAYKKCASINGLLSEEIYY